MDICSTIEGMSIREEQPEDPVHAALIVDAHKFLNVCEEPATLARVDNLIALHEEIARRLADLRAHVAAG